MLETKLIIHVSGDVNPIKSDNFKSEKSESELKIRQESGKMMQIDDNQTDDGYNSNSSTKQPFWKLTGLSRFCIAPVKYRIQKLEALGLDTSRKPQQLENKTQIVDSSTKIKHPSSNTSEPPTAKPQPTITDNSVKIPTTQTNHQTTTDNSVKIPTTQNNHQTTTDNSVKIPTTQKNHQNSTSIHPAPSPKPRDNKNDSGYIEPATATSPSETKKSTPMAFTVDLDSTASDSSTSGNSGKKLDITASISQWAPKHRRNLSLTKVEENKKLEERQGSEKPPLGRPRSGTVGAGCVGTKKGTAGYHSEGYFSSDQDEEGPRKSDLKSPRTPEAHVGLERLNSQDFPKANSVRKLSTKPEGRSCCKEKERKPSVSEISGKSYKLEKKMGSDSKKQLQNAPAEEFDPSKDDKDDVSEAGTYTIDKDSASPEEELARNDINNVFGVPAPTESEGEIGSTTTAIPMSTTDQCLEDESSWLSASEMQPPTLSRNSPNWIQQWAAHVAEQTKPPLDPMSARGHKLPVSPPDGNDPRPRRKLPTPPAYLSSPPCGMSQRSDPSSSGKHRFWEDRIVSDLQTSCQTSDTEAYLRDTENIVTSLQARVDKTKGSANPAFRHNNTHNNHNNHNSVGAFESHESGADSDFDTCNSYPFNEDERMSAALKSKLRLTGLLPASKNSGVSPSAGVTSPRRSDGGPGKEGPKMKAYDMYNNSPRRDDRCLQSDSSSEASEPYKEVPRQTDNNPPLKFNRAFSLRRARLGCDDPVSTTPDKKKLSRPSSAGAASGASRRTPALGSSSKSYHSVDNPSVSSPRGYGCGLPSSTTTRGIASPSQGGSRSTSQTDNFDRCDGGRYSLRLPRTGPSTIGIQKSPSKSSIKKDSKKNVAGRSNSTLSSKEVDFQNWKRRKNYDPMKAAAEGRKKQVDKKIKNAQQMSTSQTNSDHRSPSPPGSLLRSASFHGTEGVMGNARWSRKSNNRHHYTSEDDGPFSLEDEMGPHPSPMHGSPLHRSPTSPHQLCQSPIRQPSSTPRGRRPSLGHTDEVDPHYQASIRKIPMDESGSEGKRSPLNTGNRTSPGNPGGAVSGRPKTKMEALDNLVISTIHSLSVKVRTTSESLLQKLKSQYDEEGDRAALLEEVLSHLSESDQSLASGQTRSTSRELAGILRNLKKIEHALEVIDRVIIVGEEDYVDDDVDYVPTEWVDESDY